LNWLSDSIESAAMTVMHFARTVPSIRAAINRAAMLSLAMVVFVSLIEAKGLGNDVVGALLIIDRLAGV